MEDKNTQAQAREDHLRRNQVIKECLLDGQKRLQMNKVMAATIGREVYDHSLARVLLQPHLVEAGKCPVYSEGEHGPAVIVHLSQSEERILDCRAFRDNLREEERVKTVRDIHFVAMSGQGIRPSSFALSNVCTLRWPDLNGNAYSMVERARQRLVACLAMDETKVALRSMFWVGARFGRSLWAKSATTSSSALANAVDAIGSDKKPAIICSYGSLADILKSDVLKMFVAIPVRNNDPAITLMFGEARVAVPVYADASVPEHMIYVIPSGQAFGEMPIFIEPDVMDYDKPERLIKGWLCYQDQGMIFVNVKLTNVIYLGWKGFIEMAKNTIRRTCAW